MTAGAQAFDVPFLGYVLPLLLLGMGVFAARISTRRDVGPPPVLAPRGAGLAARGAGLAPAAPSAPLANSSLPR